MNKKNSTLPTEWTITTLGSISSNVMYGMNAKSTLYDGKHKYIRITDIDENTNKYAPNPLTSPAGVIEQKYKLIKGDLLFARTGASVGKSYLHDEANKDLFFAGFLIKFHIIKDEPYFVFLQTQTKAYKNWVQSVSMRSGQPGINAEEYKKLPLVIPPLKEQKTIAETLQTWDTAIEKTEALIAAKEKEFHATVKKVFFQYSTVKKPLSTCLKEVSKRNKGEAIERVLSVTNHSGFVLPENQFERRVASADVSNYKIVSQGEYAYNPSRINVGSIARLDDWENGILSPMYTVFKIKQNILNSDYFLHWLSSNEAKQRIKNSAQGSVRETVSFADLCSIPIPLPALATQKEIAYAFNIIKSEITLLKKLVGKYRTQKQGLMQKLLTGEWRLDV